MHLTFGKVGEREQARAKRNREESACEPAELRGKKKSERERAKTETGNSERGRGGSDEKEGGEGPKINDQ